MQCSKVRLPETYANSDSEEGIRAYDFSLPTSHWSRKHESLDSKVKKHIFIGRIFANYCPVAEDRNIGKPIKTVKLSVMVLSSANNLDPSQTGV